MVDGRDRSSSPSRQATSSRSGSKRRSRATLLAGPLVTVMCVPALAGPQGEKVVHGDASFQRNGLETVIRAADNTIINYRSFDIGANETVRFIQPGASSRVLNRVNSRDPSQIAGTLIANGQVYIVNRAGVYFHDGATVNVGALYAAAGNINNKAFLAGRDRFTLTGEVVNHGAIQGDFVGLFGNRVENFGSIVSPQGTVAMIAGDEVIVGERGGTLFAKAKASEFAGSDAAGGVVNGGEVFADGGNILVGAGDMYALVLHDTSVLRGRDVRIAGGDLTEVSGKIDASNDNGVGGYIEVTGNRVAVRGASLDASGAFGGGEILVGGDVQGTGTTRTADRTIVDGDSVLRADAIVDGDGGKVIVWADDATGFTGFISARGGAQGGDGGFAEVSGKRTLAFFGDADLAAPEGQFGELLLDPDNITIVDGASGTGADDGNADFLDGIISAGDGPADSIISEGFLESFGFALTLIANDSITVQDLTTDGILDLSAASGTITLISNFNNLGAANPNGGAFVMLGGNDIIRTGGANLFISGHTIQVSSIDTRGVGGGGRGAITLNAVDGLTIGNGAEAASINSGGGAMILNGNTNDDATGGFTLSSLASISSVDAVLPDGGDGNITIDGVDWDLSGASINAGRGNVRFVLSTPGGAAVSVGNTSAGVNLSAAELGIISSSGTFTVGQAGDSALPTSIEIEDFDLGGTSTLTGNAVFNSSGGISFVNSASTFASGLQATAGTDITISADLVASGTTAGQALGLNGAVILGADVTNTGGAVNFSTLTVAADSIVTGSSITLGGTTNGDGLGPWDLTLDGTTGAVAINGIVGGTNALDTLTVTGNSISIAANVTTDGDQSYTASGINLGATVTSTGTGTIASGIAFTGPVTLSGNAGVTTQGTTDNDDISFSSTINGGADLTLTTAGEGDISVAGVVGGSAPLDFLRVINANQLSLGTVTASALHQDAASGTTPTSTFGTLLIGNGSAPTSGIQLVGDAFVFNGLVTTVSNATTQITNAGLLDINAGFNLDGSFNQIDNAGTVNLGAGMSTTNDNITFGSAVTQSGGSFELTAGTGTISLNAWNTSANSLTLTADEIDLGGTLSGGGNLLLRPSAITTSIAVGGTLGTLDLSAADIANINNSFTLVTVGYTGTGQHAVDLGTATFQSPVLIAAPAGSIRVSGSFATNNAAMTLRGPTTFITGANLATGGGDLLVDGTLTLDGVAANISTTGGSATLASTVTGTSGGAIETLTFDLNTGNLDIQGAVSGAGGSADATGLAAITISDAGSVDLTSVAITGAFSSSVPLTGAFNANGAFSAGSLNLSTATGNAITFGGAFSTTGATTVSAGGGDAAVAFQSSTTATGGLTVTGDAIGFTGTVNAGAMSFTANSTLTFSSTVTGTAGLGYDNDGLASFGDAVTLAGAFTQTGGAGGTQFAGNVSTGNGDLTLLNSLTTTTGLNISTGTGQQSYGGTVTLGGSTIFTANGDGGANDGITFAAAVDGSGNLTFRSATNTTAYEIGDGTAGTNVLIDNASLGQLDDGFASLTFGYTTGTGAATVGTVDLTDSTTINSGTANTLLAGAISLTNGADALPANLTFASPVQIGAGGSASTAGGSIAFNNAVQVIGGASATVSSGGGNITLASTLFGQTGGGSESIAIDAGAGNIDINGRISGITGGVADATGLTDVTLTGNLVEFLGVDTTGAFTLNNAGAATIANAVNVGSFDQSGGAGAITLAGNITTTGGNILFGGDIALSLAGRTLNSGAGDITLQSVALGGFNFSLISSGTITVNGTISGGNNASIVSFTPAAVTDAIDVGDVTTPQAGALTISGATINAIDNSVALIQIGTANTGEHAIQVESFNPTDGNAFRTDVEFLAPAGAGTVTLVDDFINAGIAAAFDAAFTLASASAEIFVGSATFNGTVADNGNDLTISAQVIDFEGGVDSVSGWGTLTLRSDDSTDAMEIGADNAFVNGVRLDNDDLNALAPGFAGVEFGYAGIGAGEIAITNVNPLFSVSIDNDAVFHAPLVLLGNQISGDFSNGTNSLTFNGTFGTSLGFPIVVTAGAVTFNDGLVVNNTALTIISDSIDFLGGDNSVTGLAGLGTPELILRGLTIGTAIDVGDNISVAGGGLVLDGTDIGAIASSVARLDIGARSGSNAAIQVGDLTGAAALATNTFFNASGSGSILVEGDVNATGAASLTFNSIAQITTLASGGSITTDSGGIFFDRTRVGEGASFAVNSTSGLVSLRGVLDGTTGGAAESITFDLGTGNFTATAAIYGDAGTMLADATGLADVSFASGNDVTLLDTFVSGAITSGGTSRLTGTFATSGSMHEAGNWQLVGTDFQIGNADATIGAFEVDNAGLLSITNPILAVAGFSQTDSSGPGNGSVELGGGISTTNADISFASPVTVTSGAIELLAGTGAFAAGDTFDTQAFDFIVTANDYQLTGGAQSFTGSGTVTFRGAIASTNMDIGGVTATQGGMIFGEGDLAALDSGFSQIVFGYSGSSTPTVQLGRAFNASAHRNPTVINAQSGTITAERLIEGEAGASLQLFAGGGTTFTNGLSIDFDGGFVQVSNMLTLADDASIVTNGGNQTFGGLVNGAFALNLDALNSDGSVGTIVFADVIGSTTALSQLDVVGHDIQFNGIGTAGTTGVTGTTTVTATDDVLFTGVTYHTNAATYAASADPDGAGPRMPTGDGNLRMLSFPVDFITSGDAIAFNGQVLLFNGAPMTVTTAGGAVSFGAIDNDAGAAGPGSLVVDAGAGLVTLNGDIGGTNAIGLLDIASGGVVLGDNIAITTMGTDADDVFIRSTINGGFDLSIDTGPEGTIDIANFIGGTTALTNLTLNGFDVALGGIGSTTAQGVTGTVTVTAGDDILFGRSTYNAGVQNYAAADEARMIGTTTTFFSNGQDISINGAVVRLEPGIDFNVVSAGGDITVGGPVEGDTGAENIFLDADTGSISLAGAGGDDDSTPTSGIPSLDVIRLTADDVTLSGNLFGNMLFIEPGSVNRRINLGGSPTANALNLSTGEINFIQSGFSEVTFGRGNGEHQIFVNNATFRSDTTLQAPVGAGRVTINGPLTMAEGSTLTIIAANTTQLGGDIVTTGSDLNFDGGLILIADSTVTTGGGDITVDGTINTDTLGEWELLLDASAVAAGRVEVTGGIGDTGVLGALTIRGDSALLNTIGSLGSPGVSGTTQITVTQLLNVTGDALHSGNIDITAGTTSLDAATPITIVTTSGDARFSGPIIASNDADLTITTDVEVALGNILPTDSTVRGNIIIDGNINTGGALRLFASVAGMTPGSVEVSGNIGGTTAPTTLDIVGADISVLNVTTQGNQSYTGNTTIDGQLLVTGPGSIGIDGDLIVIAESRLTTQGAAADDVTITGDITALNPSDATSLTISTGDDGDVVAGNVSGLSAFDVTADDITVGSIDAGQVAFGFIGGNTGLVTIGGDVNTTGDNGVAITAQQVDVAGGVNAANEGSVLVTVLDGFSASGSVEGATVTISGGDHTFGGDVLARTGAITLTANDVTVDGSLSAANGAVTITGAGGFADNVRIGGDTTAASGGININAESILHDGAITTTGGGSYVASIQQNTDTGENNRVRFSGPANITGSFIQTGSSGDVRIGFNTLDVGINDVLIEGQVTLNSDLTITGVSIDIGNTIDSGVGGMGNTISRSLTINADDDVRLGTIGRRTDASSNERALTSLTVNGVTATTITLLGDVVTTEGQTYNADVVTNAVSNLEAGGDIAFAETLATGGNFSAMSTGGGFSVGGTFTTDADATISAMDGRADFGDAAVLGGSTMISASEGIRFASDILATSTVTSSDTLMLELLGEVPQFDTSSANALPAELEANLAKIEVVGNIGSSANPMGIVRLVPQTLGAGGVPLGSTIILGNAADAVTPGTALQDINIHASSFVVDGITSLSALGNLTIDTLTNTDPAAPHIIVLTDTNVLGTLTLRANDIFLVPRVASNTLIVDTVGGSNVEFIVQSPGAAIAVGSLQVSGGADDGSPVVPSFFATAVMESATTGDLEMVASDLGISSLNLLGSAASAARDGGLAFLSLPGGTGSIGTGGDFVDQTILTAIRESDNPDNNLFGAFSRNEFLIDLGGGRIFVADLTGDGQTAEGLATALAGAVAAASDIEDLPEDTTLSATAREELEELGLQIREATVGTLLESIVGFALYNDTFVQGAGERSGLRAQTTANRLDFALVSNVIAGYRDLLQEQRRDPETGEILVDPETGAPIYDDRSLEIQAQLAEAVDAYYDQTGAFEFSPSGFNRFIESDPAFSEQVATIERLRELLNDVRLLGLSPYEFNLVKQTILGYVRPQSLSLQELTAVVDNEQMDEAAMPEADLLLDESDTGE